MLRTTSSSSNDFTSHFRRCYFLVLSRIAATPIDQIKMAFSYHAHLLAENVTRFRLRVAEMRDAISAWRLSQIPPTLFFLMTYLPLLPFGRNDGLVSIQWLCLLCSLPFAITFGSINSLVDQPSVRILKYLLAHL